MPNIVYLHGFASSPLSTKGRFFHSRFEVIGGQVHQPDLENGSFQKLTITGQLNVVDRAVRGVPKLKRQKVVVAPAARIRLAS